MSIPTPEERHEAEINELKERLNRLHYEVQDLSNALKYITDRVHKMHGELNDVKFIANRRT